MVCVPVLLYQGLILALPGFQNGLAGVPSLASDLFISFGYCLCRAAGAGCSLPAPTLFFPYCPENLRITCSVARYIPHACPPVPTLTLVHLILSVSTFFQSASVALCQVRRYLLPQVCLYSSLLQLGSLPFSLLLEVTVVP